jgi:hypothetical protein
MVKQKTGVCTLPRYDWSTDPKGYRDEQGRIPNDRCFHCGSRYANPSPFSAFCRDCWADLNLENHEPFKGYWAIINTRIRLSDGTPVGNFMKADGNGLF